MKTTIISYLIMITTSLINAQSLEGNYSISTSNGEITLRLATSDDINYSGKMVGDDGSNFSVNAAKNSSTGIQGTITGQQNRIGFSAFLNNHLLNMSLMPLDQNGIPDYNQAQTFVMNPVSANSMASGAQGGPLALLGTEPSWQGTYYGDINGTATTLKIDQEGQTVSGKIDAAGYIYNLSGTITNNEFSGELVDPQTQAKMACSGTCTPEQLILTMKDYNTKQSFSLTFSKNKNSPVDNTSIHTKTNAHAGSQQRDPNLIGNWLYASSYTSGDFGFTTQYRLIINQDGTYLYGDAKMAGGGPGSSVSSEGGGYTKGQWKTQNKTILINEGSGWQSYAGYYVEGNSMLMKFSDGSKQLWERY